MENNFVVTKLEECAVEREKRYNKRFEELYFEVMNEDFEGNKLKKVFTEEESESSVEYIIRKYKNKYKYNVRISDDELKQVVLDAIWEVAQKDFDSKGNPMENHLAYFRSIVGFRLMTYVDSNESLGEIKEYKELKEKTNIEYTEKEMLNTIGLTERRYKNLMEKENFNTALSLDINNSNEGSGNLNFYDNHGEIDKGYEKIENWKRHKMSDQERYEELYEVTREIFKKNFPNDKGENNEKYFRTYIESKVNGKTGLAISKEEGVNYRTISKRLKTIEKKEIGLKIIEALEEKERLRKDYWNVV